MKRRNSLCTRLEGCIGTELAVHFCAVHGSRTRDTNIPKTMASGKAKMFAQSIGESATEKLLDCFGGEALRVPTLNAFYEEVRNSFVRVQLLASVNIKDIAAETNLSVERVRQIRRWVVKGVTAQSARMAAMPRVARPTARTAAVYRAVLPTSLAATYAPDNMTPEVAREALRFFALFSPQPTSRPERKKSKSSTTDPPATPSYCLEDAWMQLVRKAQSVAANPQKT